MAIKITAEGLVQTIQPFRSYYDLKDLEDTVGGMIEPVKIGPVWVIYSESSKTKKELLNEVASFFFDVAMYGTVLVVPPQQLPLDWDIMDENDYKYTSEQVEEGFLISLQRSLIENMNMPILRTQNGNQFNYKEEFTYRPPNEYESDDLQTKEFYHQICEKPIDIIKLKTEGIILEEKNVIIRIKEHADKLKLFDQMIACYLETEDYEKCASLRNLKQELVEVC